MHARIKIKVHPCPNSIPSYCPYPEFDTGCALRSWTLRSSSGVGLRGGGGGRGPDGAGRTGCVYAVGVAPALAGTLSEYFGMDSAVGMRSPKVGLLDA